MQYWAKFDLDVQFIYQKHSILLWAHLVNFSSLPKINIEMKLMKAQRRQISKKGPQDSCNYLILFSFDVFKMDSPRSINTDIWQEKLICSSSIQNILFNGVITSTRCSIKETLFMSLKQRSTSTKWLGSYFMLEQEQWIIFFTKMDLQWNVVNQLHILHLFAFVQEDCTTAILLYT